MFRLRLSVEDPAPDRVRVDEGEAPLDEAGPDVVVTHGAAAFHAAAEPWLGGLGEWSELEVPGAFGWYWNLTSCCLWYQTDGGW